MSQDHSRSSVGPTLYGHAVPAVWSPADTLLRAGVMGAVVGASAAVATEYRRLRDGETTREAAARDVAVTAGKVGLATGLGALAAATLRGGPLVSAVAMVTTGAAALHVMNGPGRGARPDAAVETAAADVTTKTSE